MVKYPTKSMKKKLLTMRFFKVQMTLIIMQLTTPLLTTKHCDSEIVALKEQMKCQNIEIQALK